MYFALKDTPELVKDLLKKKTDFDLFLKDTGRQLLYNTLYRGFYQGKYHCGQMYTTGENGEFMNINVNEFRNNILHIKSLILSNKITLTPSATTTDVDALSQALLGKNVMSHYTKFLKLDLLMDTWLDTTLLYADSYALLKWNPFLGKPVIQNEFGRKIYEGEPEIQIFPPHMVAIDPQNPDSEWHIFQYKINKYNLAIQFPEFADEIEKTQLDIKYDFDAQLSQTNGKYTNDAIYVYEFFHKDTPLVPGGRTTLYINDKIILKDGPLNLPFYPVTKFQVSNVEDTPFGYSATFDSVQLCNANNKVFSTMITNESKFGVQLVLTPKGADLDVTDVVDGAKFIEYDPAAGVPTGLNLLATSQQTFDLSTLISAKNDMTMGMNEVTKGQAPKDIESGNALALLQSMTVQFNSTGQKNFVVSLEELGGKLMWLLQLKVTNQRLLELVGEDQAMYTKEWTGQAIAGIQKCTVELGDPAKDTAVGRQQMADTVAQYIQGTTVDQYFQIKETGNAGIEINKKVSHAMLISRENEMLMKGQKPILAKTDKHLDHIATHACLIDRPEVRGNPALAKVILEHNLEHEMLYKQLAMTDPLFLQMTGQQLMPVTPGVTPATPPEQIPPGGPQQPGMPSQPTNPLNGQEFSPTQNPGAVQ